MYDIFSENEKQFSRWNFEVADTTMLLRQFDEAEAECERILSQSPIHESCGSEIIMTGPAYDQCLVASH